MHNLQNVPVLVLGLGVSGLAMARWCARNGAQVTVVDTREVPPQLAKLRLELPEVRFIHSRFVPSLLQENDARIVFKSPGLKPQELLPILQMAREQEIEIKGELELFNQELLRLRVEKKYQPFVLAITGTNGKTTVTLLTRNILTRSGLNVAVAGNVGPSLLDTLTARMQENDLPQVWVLELSSFQLNEISSFEPSIGTVLNISSDHLDWHENLLAYVRAKKNIFGSLNPMLLNRDDPQVMAMLPPSLKGREQRRFISFGLDLPSRPGDFGMETVNGMTWLVRAKQVDETTKRRKESLGEIFIQRLIPANALRIRGRHNASNALAALALACATNASLGLMLYGLREYRGEPHRVEYVDIIRDVEFFNDSKGTNVGATLAALTGFEADRKLVVILGGDGKGQEFSSLADPVARFARALVLIGKDAGVIATALQDTLIPIFRSSTLPDAVRVAFSQAKAGDAVLLSPACASLDMFDNYQHRGQVFCNTVMELNAEADLQGSIR